MNVVALHRVRNLTPPRNQRERCDTCHDTGQLVAASRNDTHNGRTATVEEMGPCPYCELGYKIEYEPGSPWGQDGFWQGRDLPPRAPFAANRPMTQAEQIAAIQTLATRIGRSLPTEDDDPRPTITDVRREVPDEQYFGHQTIEGGP